MVKQIKGIDYFGIKDIHLQDRNKEEIIIKQSIVLTLKKFLLNLLWWHWLLRLYRFQVHNSITHHLYIEFCAHHSKLSLLLSYIWPPLPFSINSHLLPL